MEPLSAATVSLALFELFRAVGRELLQAKNDVRCLYTPVEAELPHRATHGLFCQLTRSGPQLPRFPVDIYSSGKALQRRQDERETQEDKAVAQALLVIVHDVQGLMC